MRKVALVEALSGVAAGALGLLLLAYFLFAPILRDTSATMRADGSMSTSVTYASAVQHGLPAFYIAFFAVLALVLVGVALCAIADARTRRAGWHRLLTALVAAQVLLVAFLLVVALDYLPPRATAATLWNALSVTGGGFLLPSLALALVAVLLARRRAGRALVATR